MAHSCRPLFLFLISFFILPVAAQTVLTGTVFELYGDDKEPCMGVNVSIVNAENRLLTGIITDMDGNYSLQVPEGQHLTVVFSYVGMSSQRIPYSGQHRLDVTLSEDAQTLGEVQIVAQKLDRSELGVSVHDFTGASQKMNMAEVAEVTPVSSVEEMLQGQLAGVDILAGGDPGAKGNIRIRGTATLNSNADPLIVVNGVPYNADISDDFDFSTANTEDFADMLALNPNDIETIEVLKDAASTAIYGTKGANGVLLITTKTGAKGKPKFIFSHKSTVKFEPDPIPMLTGDEYTAYMQDAIWNTANARGLANSGALLGQLFSHKSYAIGYQPDWSYFDEYNQNVSWLDAVRKNAYSTDNNFSMSGGGEKATYRFSLGWTGEDGTTRNNDMGRLTSTLRIGYKFSDRMTVNAEFSYSDTKNTAAYFDSGSVRTEALRKMPNKSPYYIDDTTGLPTDIWFTYQDANEFQGAYNGSKNFHPIAMVDASFSTTGSKEEKFTLSPSYIMLWDDDHNPILRAQGYVSMKFNTVKSRSFLPQEATGVDIANTASNFSMDASTNNFLLQSEAKLLYTQSLRDGLHNLVGTLIWRTKQSSGSSYTNQVYGVATGGMAEPAGGGTTYNGSLASGTSDARTLSLLGNANYTFHRFLSLNGTWNYEGNSALGPANRWALFQSYGVALNLQDIPFIATALGRNASDHHPSWLSQAKLRASWGQSGNAPSGTSPYVGTYTALTEKYGTATPVVPEKMQLSNLRWETTEEWDVGADLAFWGDRLKMTVDIYDKTSRDLLQKSVRVASTSSYSSIAYTNSGALQNRGAEFRVEGVAYEDKKIRFGADFNIARDVNTILELPSNISEETYSLGNGNYAQRLLVGTPVGSFFGYHYEGVYQNLDDTYARDAEGAVMHDLEGHAIVMKNGTYTCYPGDAKYQDVNHDGMIDENDIIYIGNCNPVVTGGAGLNIRYGICILTARFHYRIGQKIINSARMTSEAMYNEDNQSKAVLRRWRSPGDDTEIPRALYKYGYNYLGSDRFVEDCSYVRLQTLSLAFKLPKEMAAKMGATGASAFVTGYDLFTLTDYTGQDPEVTLPSRVTSLAYDRSSTPRSRRVAVGVTLNF